VWWLALEIVLGLALFVWLIWWTIPRKNPRETEDAERAGPPKQDR
jgi:hypothetical protein